jgi:hypothetical protein
LIDDKQAEFQKDIPANGNNRDEEPLCGLKTFLGRSAYGWGDEYFFWVIRGYFEKSLLSDRFLWTPLRIKKINEQNS